MKNYIFADIYRLRRRRPRIVLLILVYIGAVLGMYFAKSRLEWNTVAFLGTFEAGFGVAGLFVCLVEFLFVYASDFKARIMQAAIGRGLSRSQVVLAKYLELLIQDAVSLGVLWALILVFGEATGAHPNPGQLLEMLAVYTAALLNEVIVTGIAAFFLFLLQNAGVAAVFYAVLFWDPMQYILTMLSEKIKLIVTLHLKDFCYGAVCDRFKSHLLLGQFNFPALLLIVLYIAAVYFATVWVFKRRELEF